MSGKRPKEKQWKGEEERDVFGGKMVKGIMRKYWEECKGGRVKDREGRELVRRLEGKG